MGKTTTLLQLLEQLRGSAQTVFLFQTQCTSRELLRYLLVDLGVKTPKRGLVEMHEQLKEVLLETFRGGKRLVLVIDEAQGLDDAALELVRLLSNFETSDSKLMQIVLAGQPTLGSRLGDPTQDPLRQRVSIISYLEPLGPEEVSRYIDHRMQVAGHAGQSLFAQPLFSNDALELLAKESHGIPRLINNICFNALSLGYAERQRIINAAMMKRVVADFSLNIDESGTCVTFPPCPDPSPSATYLLCPTEASSSAVETVVSASEGFSAPSSNLPAQQFVERTPSGFSGFRTWVTRLVSLFVLPIMLWGFVPLGRKLHNLRATEVFTTKLKRTTCGSEGIRKVLLSIDLNRSAAASRMSSGPEWEIGDRAWGTSRELGTGPAGISAADRQAQTTEVIAVSTGGY